MAKQEMPTYLSLLFRARRPLDPLTAPFTPCYKNRPVEPMIDQHRAGKSGEGLLGQVTKEEGEKWLETLFENPGDVKDPETGKVDPKAAKEQFQKRAHKQKIKEHLLAQKALVK